MQNNRQRLKATPYHAHHLDRLSKPYFWWLYIFACFPVLIMVFLMFVDTEGIRLDEMEFTMYNFTLLSNQSVLIAFYNSLKYSLLTTLLCIFFGYLLAYTLFKSNLKNKYLILLLLILPMWTNILLRITALANIFKPNNILTDLLGIPGLNIIGTDWAILLGMVFTYLPFIVLPIYTSLEKIDPSLEEAANDLGVTDFTKFWKVIVPLSLKGVFSGSLMVFLPCLSGFAIPKVLGEGKILLIGNIIEQNFINMSYNYGAVLAVLILIIILGAIAVINKIDKEGEMLL
ncbi:MAG TPA: ABC transporter permease [Candidatus Pelethenecus faecipullorum]|uniref:ABC transporter permease n=1 Tax=Candidatus Pelethenecus faecipullorum TaxID=2840900 RepID=A0A9D1KJP0_9MOLU|nr:ABC transporter permease [Candidatus Pelethenecus faecipullorum]